MININGKQLCDCCFEEVTGPLCPHCGYNAEASETDLITLQPGSMLINKYIVGKIIGMGGFGITYLAYDISQDKKIAVKEFFPYGVVARANGYATVSAVSPDKSDTFKLGAEKFYNEAKLVSRFNGNPNIVSVYGFFYENGTVYFSMEYLKGHTLKDRIKNHGTLNESQALYVIQSVVNALEAAHGSSVLHRDISPDNIIICDNGDIKLIDFGAARQVIAEQSQTFSVILKPGFAPLEQYQKKGHQGPWTDIYSLGATVYYALTGEIPEDPMSRMDDDEVYRSNKHNINSDFWNIISKATELRIENRYSDISQLKYDLDMIAIEAAPLVVPEKAKMPYKKTQWVLQPDGADAAAQTEEYRQSEDADTPAPAKSRAPLISAICSASAVAVIAAAIIIPLALNVSKNDDDVTDVQAGTTTSYSESESENEGESDGVTEDVTDREYTTPDGKTVSYTGQWKNGMPEGQGKGIYESGDVYEGGWKNGVQSGQGKYTWADGHIYKGEFENGVRSGQGVMTWAGGGVYDGEWKDDKRSGQGVMNFADGTVYEGEWRNDRRTGEGKMTYEGGGTYEGAWKNDKRNGYGTLITDKGEAFFGFWKDDILIE